MTETLFHAYLPLIVWTSLGLLSYRLLPQTFPHLLGRGLYWVGIPVEILALARRTNFANAAGLASLITITALIIGCCLAALCLLLLKRFAAPSDISRNAAMQGSFVLTSVLGNTGFVGLAIAPVLIADHYLNWIVFYSITHNLIGTYGFGVLIASYFGNDAHQNRWWIQLRAILSVPSLWAFVIGCTTQSVPLPQFIASGLQDSIKIVIPCAFVLIGLRLSQLRGWKSFQLALIPAVIKVIVTPVIVGAIAYAFGLSGDCRLAMILMSGMPCAFASLILAEEYNLNRELIASSIVVSTLLWLFVLPFWLY